jgi:hypothetical protein
MFLSLKSLSHIVYHPFKMMGSIISIQDIRNIFKGKVTWDEPIEKAQP